MVRSHLQLRVLSSPVQTIVFGGSSIYWSTGDFQRPLVIVIDCGHSIVCMISLIFLDETNVKRIVIGDCDCDCDCIMY